MAHGRPSGPQTEALRAIFSRRDRSQHSERRAMLKVVERLGEGHASLNATGSVRLFSCHTPCMSCLFVFAQFRAMYPKVRLTVAFMSWTETYAALQEAKRDGQRQNGMVCGFCQGKESTRGRVMFTQTKNSKCSRQFEKYHWNLEPVRVRQRLSRFLP